MTADGACDSEPVYRTIVERQPHAVIAEYKVSAANPDQADPASERILLTVDQPSTFSNHKGGQLAFGNDGFLYIGLGDGGSEGDPLGKGQNLQTLLGKMLRIDVDHTDPVQSLERQRSAQVTCGDDTGNPVAQSYVHPCLKDAVAIHGH